MIFKDAQAKDDSNGAPGRRDEDCLNCNKDWGGHYGWGCHSTKTFHQAHANERYLTASMRDSIVNADPQKQPVQKVAAEEARNDMDWRVWRHIEPGHCACGIVRENCEYHRGG